MRMLVTIITVLALFLISCSKTELVPQWEEAGTEVEVYSNTKGLMTCERDYPIGSTRKIKVVGEGVCFNGYGNCTYIGDGSSKQNETLKYVWKFYSKRTGACAYFSQDDGSNPVASISTRFLNFYQPDITRLTVRPGRNGRLYVIAKTNTLVL